jgi:hypothetical protein
MKEVTQGNWSAEIPASATAGNRVAYYIEAQGAEENTIASRGTADDPLVIVLKGSGAPGTEEEGEEEDDEDDEDAPKWFIGVGAGTGVGWVTGNAEVNSDIKVKGGFAPASLGQLAPEVGRFLSPRWLLSVQLRLQLVSGANQLKVPQGVGLDDQCGADHICKPAGGAFAVLARMTRVFGEERLHPYVSIVGGGGEMRHTVKLLRKFCGTSGQAQCYDTVLAGPVFVGGGGGLMFNASKNFVLMAGVTALAGIPKFTLNFDFNAGIGVEF